MYRQTSCKLQAHRGVCTEAPENTFAAFRLAVEQGYDVIECDPKFTKDGVCVILHDRTLNRTGRKNGLAPESPLAITDVTYEQLQEYDVGEWFDPKFKGERAPLLTDVLQFAADNGMELKIDNVVQSFTAGQIDIVFDSIKNSKAKAGLTCSDLALLKRFAECVPDAPLHYDGPVSEEALCELASFSQGREVTVWMRQANKLTSWNVNPPVDEAFAKRVKQSFKLGVWILSDDEQMAQAVALGADIVETTGGVKP